MPNHFALNPDTRTLEPYMPKTLLNYPDRVGLKE